jgi:hypothetical protein
MWDGGWGLFNSEEWVPKVLPETKLAIEGAQIVLMVIGGIWTGIEQGLGKAGSGIFRLFRRADKLGDAAGGGGATTYEILDGVRRSKAAQIAGQGSIEAEIQVGGRIIGRESVVLDALRSPKEAISTAGSGLDRWLNTLRQTLSGSKPPPIQVTPGTRGTPITDVLIE